MLENIYLLKEDLERKNWCISSFPFKYKKNDYVVVFEILEKPHKKYYCVALTFYNEHDECLTMYANNKTLSFDFAEFCRFFDIRYENGKYEFVNEFKVLINNAVPKTQPEKFTDEETTVMVRQLNKRDNEDLDAIYCFGAYHNPGNKKRTKYNSDKTKLLRPNLFEEFGRDTKISFKFSPDPLKHKEDFEIRRLLE